MKKIFLMTLIGLCFYMPAQGQTITVTSPAAGVNWQIGTSYTVTWTKSGAMAATVKIRLRRAGSPEAEDAVWSITDSTPNDGSFGTAVVPASVPAGDYYIRVRTTGAQDVIGDGEIFHVSGMQVISRLPPDRMPPLRLKFPRLAVSDIDLAPNADGFGIVFNYKNVGEGALPKASEVPVKPSYRVLIDGIEKAKGFLFIPAFQAQPGWEQKGYFGGWIVLTNWALLGHQNPLPVYSNTLSEPIWQWHIGNSITVHINENKVMGMDSHSLSLNLRNILLKYKYDWMCTGIDYDWNTRRLTISLKLEGQMPVNRNFSLVCNGRYLPGAAQWVVSGKLDKNLYSFSRKVDVPQSENHLSFEVFTTVSWTSPQEKIADIDLRNNAFARKFDRPPRPAESQR